MVWVRSDLERLIHNRKLILELYDALAVIEDKYNKTVLCYEAEKVNLFETLAATRELSEQRRVLIKRHQWVRNGDDLEKYCGYECPECGNDQMRGHAPDCAWDAALKDVGGE